MHGSPRDPLMEYIISTDIAQRNFEFFDTKYCFAGHTHIAAAYKEEGRGSSLGSKFEAGNRAGRRDSTV